MQFLINDQFITSWTEDRAIHLKERAHSVLQQFTKIPEQYLQQLEKRISEDFDNERRPSFAYNWAHEHEKKSIEYTTSLHTSTNAKTYR